MADRGRGRGRGRGHGLNHDHTQSHSRANGRNGTRGGGSGYSNRGTLPRSLPDMTNHQQGSFPNNASYQQQAKYANGSDNGEVNAHLAERFSGRSRRPQPASSCSDAPVYRAVANPNIAKYVQDQRKISETCPDPDSWLAKPEIPSSAEICPPDGTEVALPANKINLPWSKPTSYLKTHYHLLREDAVAPLREAVSKFRKDPQRMDDNDIRIYEQVRLVGLTFTYKGIAARIRFSTARSGRKILWSASKRLTSGTLVALTPTKDEFRSKCILAIVAARPLQNLEVSPPEIDILFGVDEYHEVDPQNSFIMIEASSGYFEAYRHTLRALQKQSQET